MTNKPLGWPTHGKAVNARDDTAMRMHKALRELDELDRLVANGEMTRLDASISSAKLRRLINDTLIDMIIQGAPYQLP